MTDREAMQQALSALEFNLPVIEDFGSKEQLTDCHRAITALYKSLAQPEQEPVAWVKKLNTMIIGCVDVINEDDVHEDAKKLAKLVKKDCYEILQNLEEKNGDARSES